MTTTSTTTTLDQSCQTSPALRGASEELLAATMEAALAMHTVVHTAAAADGTEAAMEEAAATVVGEMEEEEAEAEAEEVVEMAVVVEEDVRSESHLYRPVESKTRL